MNKRCPRSLPKKKKDRKPQIQEASSTESRVSANKFTYRKIIAKLLKTKGIRDKRT